MTFLGGIILIALSNPKYTIAIAIHQSCPCPRQCAESLNQLQDDFGKYVRVIAVIDSDSPTAIRDLKDKKVQLEIRLDPTRSLLKAMGAGFTLDIALMDDRRNRIARWDGFDRANVLSLALKLGTLLERKVQIQSGKYPPRTQTGCKIEFGPLNRF